MTKCRTLPDELWCWGLTIGSDLVSYSRQIHSFNPRYSPLYSPVYNKISNFLHLYLYEYSHSWKNIKDIKQFFKNLKNVENNISYRFFREINFIILNVMKKIKRTYIITHLILAYTHIYTHISTIIFFKSFTHTHTHKSSYKIL